MTFRKITFIVAAFFFLIFTYSQIEVIFFESVNRQSICESKISPFVALTASIPITGSEQLKLLIEKGYIDRGNHLVNYPPGSSWFRSDGQHRSVNYNYHSWNILKPLWLTLSQADLPLEYEPKIKALILETTRQWFAQFSDYQEHKKGGDFSWYDMAVGLRANMLPNILQLGACSTEISDKEFSKWWKNAIHHAEVLSRDSFHKKHNNHGLYQALGHYTFCKEMSMVDRCASDLKIAKSRIRYYTDNFFAASGVHLEHSPAYHDFMISAFSIIRLNPELNSVVTAEFTQKVSDSLEYFTLPDQQLAQLGDTDLKKINSKQQRPEHPELKLFTEAGYGVVRDVDSHLIVSSAFHSRTHKHVDDGSFVWFDRNLRLVVDSGRFGFGRAKVSEARQQQLLDTGFWYSDPKRIYVESVHAHSTVEIDHISDNRAKAKFYGSGLKKGGRNKDGIYYFYLKMPRVGGNVTQHRHFSYKPGEWLLVVDYMQPLDNLVHDYTSWIQLNAEAELISTTEKFASFRFEDEVLNIVTLSQNAILNLSKGETQPRLSGWRSPKANSLVPAWSVGAKKSGSGGVYIANLLSLNGVPQPIDPDTSIMGVKADGALEFSWVEAGMPLSVDVAFHQGTRD